MKVDKTLLVSGVVAALALTALASAEAQTNVPKPTYKFEKCFGIVKAGKNDCFSVSHTCGGTSATDNDGDAWVYVPAGTCDKIVGGSTAPITSDGKNNQ